MEDKIRSLEERSKGTNSPGYWEDHHLFNIYFKSPRINYRRISIENYSKKELAIQSKNEEEELRLGRGEQRITATVKCSECYNLVVQN